MSAVGEVERRLLDAVSDADIEIAEERLGVAFDERRREILRSNGSFDVQACPGSGKTTLLVAKMSILGTKWTHRTKGICVLSHTNIARQEIESKLGKTAVGRRLLSYPHFVGTIHGFVNEFLALPLLRSEGHQVQLIDDEFHGNFCRRLLHGVAANRTAKSYLANRERNTPDSTIQGLRYEGAELTLGSAAGKLPCGVDSPSGKILCQIKAEVTGKGFWRFDDMFAWAERLLVKHVKAVEFIRRRFPVVFIDEAQDTSAAQGRVLDIAFPARACALRQRFGDTNQAIYDSGQSATKVDDFGRSGGLTLPNSQRFGPTIASKVHFLAPVPPAPSLVGAGPRPRSLGGGSCAVEMPHTVFLFGRESSGLVLPAFGSLLLASFSDGAIRHKDFVARAIARVGRSSAAEARCPRHLGDYWHSFEPRTSRPDLRPERLVGYVQLAQRRSGRMGDRTESIRTVCAGVSELVRSVQPTLVPRGGSVVRRLADVLRAHEGSVSLFRELLWRWCVDARVVVPASWARDIAVLRRALAPFVGVAWPAEAESFCQWSDEHAGATQGVEEEAVSTPNRYRVEQSGRWVDIDVGTIHGAKGQTHTATLVLESFFKLHDVQDLMEWIRGRKRGADSGVGVERRERMRLLYTAMTRPSHLLCLAVRADGIRESGEEVSARQQLQELGWAVREVGG